MVDPPADAVEPGPLADDLVHHAGQQVVPVRQHDPQRTFDPVDAVAVAGSTLVSWARSGVIERAGFGDRFVHGLGHGVGLEVHEEPRLGPRSSEELLRGDVVTIEPGIYISGEFGVRVEDLVLVGESGVETNFSSHSKDLLEVG